MRTWERQGEEGGAVAGGSGGESVDRERRECGCSRWVRGGGRARVTCGEAGERRRGGGWRARAGAGVRKGGGAGIPSARSKGRQQVTQSSW